VFSRIANGRGALVVAAAKHILPLLIAVFDFGIGTRLEIVPDSIARILADCFVPFPAVCLCVQRVYPVVSHEVLLARIDRSAGADATVGGHAGVHVDITGLRRGRRRTAGASEAGPGGIFQIATLGGSGSASALALA
jgi:hypothetical protein